MLCSGQVTRRENTKRLCSTKSPAQVRSHYCFAREGYYSSCYASSDKRTKQQPEPWAGVTATRRRSTGRPSRGGEPLHVPIGPSKRPSPRARTKHSRNQQPFPTQATHTNPTPAGSSLSLVNHSPRQPVSDARETEDETREKHGRGGGAEAGAGVLGRGRAPLRRVRGGAGAAALPRRRRVSVPRVRRARARARLPPRARLALRGLRARARRRHLPRRRRRALRRLRRRHPLRQPARAPPRARARRALLRRARRRAAALPVPGLRGRRGQPGGGGGRRREQRGRGGVLAPPRARQQQRGERRLLRGLGLVPRRRPRLRALHGRHQGHRRAGRAAGDGPRRLRRVLLSRTLHEPQRVVVGGGGGPGRPGRRSAGGGEQGEGSGGAADAVPGEAQEPALRQDHPLRVPQGVRRDAPPHQGPLRQALLRRRRRA